MVNRSAIVIKARKPFLDWLKSLPDPEDQGTTLKEINEGANVYLLPPYWAEMNSTSVQWEFYSAIFEMELYDWWADEADWPAGRDLKMFHKWFNPELHDVIEDLVDAPLIDED